MVKDQTDFNYGRAHVYDVFITTDERAVVARTKEQREMLQELGHVYFVRISISVLAPYFLLTFGEYRRSGREIKSTFSPRPFIKDQIHIAQQLTLEMERAGFRPLTEGLAETIVADVGTELRPQGTATVSDLIIGPY
jgi:hypothetical protein